MRTNTSLHSLSTVDRLKDLSIGYRLPRRHRLGRFVKWKNQNVHPLIVTLFYAQSWSAMTLPVSAEKYQRQ